MENIFEAITGRRSIRKYKADPVSRELVIKLVEAANWAPSGMNEQAWTFYAVAGDKVEALREIGRQVINLRMPPEAERTEEQKAFAHWYSTLGDAPVAIVACCPKSEDAPRRKMLLESAAAAFQNLLLAAAAEGLGSCWMTGLLAKQDQIYQMLDIPADKEIVAITPLGFPEGQPEAPARKLSAEKIITFIGM